MESYPNFEFYQPFSSEFLLVFYDLDQLKKVVLDVDFKCYENNKNKNSYYNFTSYFA